jgi:hypothetical protein
MPEISISERQHERLEQVRQDVEEAYVDDYGYIPIEDAVQYLLDTYTHPEQRGGADDYERLATAEYPQLQAVASEVPDVPGSGIDADEMRGRLLAELGVEAFAAELQAVSDVESRQPPEVASGSGAESAPDPGTGDTPEGAGTGGDRTDGASSDRSSGGPSAGEGGSPSADGDGEGAGPADSSPGGAGVSGGNDPLAAVNRMLSEHDDKWREGSGDEPYEVDLPDGSTESVRTKDDVRQLLFRHY